MVGVTEGFASNAGTAQFIRQSSPRIKMVDPIKVMFDTNVFSHILSGEIPINCIPTNWEIHGTHIQKDEINNTQDECKKKRLLRIFSQWLDESLPTESAVWDISNWDEAKSGNDQNNLFEKILNEMNTLKKRKNNNRDALIAETAIQNDLTLVTNDRILKKVAESNGATVIDLRKQNK